MGLGDGQTRTLDLPSKSDCSGTELSELSEIFENFKLVNQSTIFEWLTAADRWRHPPLHARAARAGPPHGGQSMVNNSFCYHAVYVTCKHDGVKMLMRMVFVDLLKQICQRHSRKNLRS